MRFLVIFVLCLTRAISSSLALAVSHDSRLEDTSTQESVDETPVFTAPSDETRVDRRADNSMLNHGIFVDTDTCQPGYGLEAALSTIHQTSLIARAGLNTMSPEFINVKGNPAPWFFKPANYDLVRNLFELVLSYAQGYDDGASVRVTCADELNKCSIFDHFNGFPALYVVPKTTDIVICPGLWKFPVLGVPCATGLSTDGLQGAGATTRAELLLFIFVQAISSGRVFGQYLGTRDCHALLDRSTDDPWATTIFNADSYARLAQWAWDLGFLDPVPKIPGEMLGPQITCFNLFPPGPNSRAGELPIKSGMHNGLVPVPNPKLVN